MDRLKFVNEQMNILAIPYEFAEWTSDIQYPYYVGEISAGEEYSTEDGKTETTMFLTGFCRGAGAMMALEETKERIRKHFHPVTGCCAKTENGVVAAFFDGSFYVPTMEADLKKIQINLRIIEWKGV